MARTTEHRLRVYATYAAVPAAGLTAATTLAEGSGGSDFFHYGGPAIEIARNMTSTNIGSSSRQIVNEFGIFFGTLSGGSASSDSATFMAKNAFIRGYDVEGNLTNQERKAFIGGLNTAFGNERIEESGVRIDDGMSFLNNIGIISVSDFDQTTYGDFNIERSGSWQADGEEVRGFMAFAGPIDDEQGFQGFGWVDIGWDGDTLSIYDWAVNFAGTIETGQTSAASAIPGAGGLAALAMGAAGLRRRRKRSA